MTSSDDEPRLASQAGANGGRRARIGVDIGGTFTDVVYSDGSAGVRHVKTLTTPEDITTGILLGLDKVEAEVGALEFFLHGTTVALNAFLEGKTPQVGLITTRGFRDVLEIMRTNRPDMYNLQQTKPAPLVPRRLRREISARTSNTGEELSAVGEGEVRAIADDFVEAGIRAVAVCLLHSYADPSHERRVREILLSAHPDLAVSISSDLSREWREFERTSTTVVNATTAPIMERYLRRLGSLLEERGFASELLIMQSSSGVMTADDAIRRPAATLMSGPVGGVAGAEAVARALGGDVNLVTLDIGGTSADVAIIDRGRAVHTPRAELGRWPILMPMVEIRSIGAGGGSIASVDAHGGLRVGPESAGAAPGPACYARGGLRATVTDANLVLGRIDGSRFLDGDFPLDVDAARAAILRYVAEPYGMTVEEAAEGVLTVVNSNMSRLLRDVLIQRGYDPRNFMLLAFGGGGPLHACAVARESGVPRVVVPLHPGTLSAYGIFCADLRRDCQAMFLRKASELSAGELEAAFGELEHEARSAVALSGSFSTDMTRYVELRYSGQEYTLQVTGAPSLEVDEYVRRFHDEHRRLYGFARESVPAEFVKVSVSHVVRTGADAASRNGAAGERANPAPAIRIVWERKSLREVPVFERAWLSAGDDLPGPCIVEEPGATTYVPEGWQGAIDDHGNLVIDHLDAEALPERRAR